MKNTCLLKYFACGCLIVLVLLALACANQTKPAVPLKETERSVNRAGTGGTGASWW